MIIFLFGTWGAGKSYVGDLIQRECGLLHMEADIQFDKKMLNALHARKYHQLDLTYYYDRVVRDIFNFQRRTNHFVVSQGIYQEVYRKMIYNVFDPDIRFIWVKYQNTKLQKERLNQRAATYGNPISAELYDYMLEYWEDPTIPHYSLMNDPDLKHSIKTLLNRWGLCVSWDV
jgi:gluconate kinase